MEVSIASDTIIKLSLIGASAYLFAPAFLVLRDFVLWKVIQKFLLNAKLRRYVMIRANDVWHLNNRYYQSQKIELLESGSKFYLDDIEVSAEEYEAFERGIEFHGERADRTGTEIVWRANLLNWLLRHYKQEGISNPIPEMERKAYEQKERDEVG